MSEMTISFDKLNKSQLLTKKTLFLLSS
jgi:anaphase-promoting complex subunit 2